MEFSTATLKDLDQIIAFEHAMLSEITSLHEIASHGGHVLASDERVKEWLRDLILQGLGQPHFLYLLAHPGGAESPPVGLVVASVRDLEAVFEPLSEMHIHAIYVLLEYRQQGIGRSLIEAALAWGREQGCVEAELHVVQGNPARRLYESLGFGVFELQMRMKM